MNDSINNIKEITFEELLEQKGYIVYTNVGRSMMPLLRQRRDIIEIRKKGPERCKKYDVVLYKRDGRYILHRILEVLPDGKYIIAGDNNTFLEKDITDDQILGVMTRVFLASFFWKKLQAFLENVASPFWRKLQPHGVAGATPWKQTFFVKSY